VAGGGVVRGSVISVCACVFGLVTDGVSCKRVGVGMLYFGMRGPSAHVFFCTGWIRINHK